MRMLAKYTVFMDLDDMGHKIDESFYLSFVKGEEIMDIPFDTFDEMKKFTDKEKIQENIESQDFKEKIGVYDDSNEFFKDTDFLVVNGRTLPVDFSFLSKERE